MYSFNQSVKITGPLESGLLKEALDFAIKYSGWDAKFSNKNAERKCSFLVLEDGEYCIGYGHKDGWIEFPFDYDANIVADIIVQHLRKQEVELDPYAEDYEIGFLMENVDYSGPNYGIVKFSAISIGISK